MDYLDLEDAVLARVNDGSFCIATDNYGQIILYTNLAQTLDGTLVEFNTEDGDDGKYLVHEQMFVILCRGDENEAELEVFGPFETVVDAEKWMADVTFNGSYGCSNAHELKEVFYS